MPPKNTQPDGTASATLTTDAPAIDPSNTQAAPTVINPPIDIFDNGGFMRFTIQTAAVQTDADVGALLGVIEDKLNQLKDRPPNAQGVQAPPALTPDTPAAPTDKTLSGS